MFCCPVDPEHDEFIAHVGSEEEDPDGLGVIVYADGTVSNKWGDGVIGIPDSLVPLAEDEVDVICAYCAPSEITCIRWTN